MKLIESIAQYHNPELAKFLIIKYYPYSLVESGAVEEKFSVTLKEIFMGEYMELSRFLDDLDKSYRIHVDSEAWVHKTALVFYSNTGWDLTMDGKYAMCRTEYDRYHVFEIQKK
jgi:hypothetical protein